MRLRKIKGIEEKIKEYNKIIISNLCNDDSIEKCKSFFKNDNPIHLEIGTGKGKFICTLANNNPNINYIGCEISNSVIYKAAKKVDEQKLGNLCLLNIDASKLNEYFDKNEIEKIYLNFSDPWPKSRHEKRRLTSSTFLDIYKTILKEKGIIEFKSDNRHLFEYSLKMFNEYHFEFLEINLDLHNEEDKKTIIESGNVYNEVVTTEYEDKFKSLNKPIYYIKVRV